MFSLSDSESIVSSGIVNHNTTNRNSGDNDKIFCAKQSSQPCCPATGTEHPWLVEVTASSAAHIAKAKTIEPSVCNVDLQADGPVPQDAHIGNAMPAYLMGDGVTANQVTI